MFLLKYYYWNWHTFMYIFVMVFTVAVSFNFICGIGLPIEKGLYDPQFETFLNFAYDALTLNFP